MHRIFDPTVQDPKKKKSNGIMARSSTTTARKQRAMSNSATTGMDTAVGSGFETESMSTPLPPPPPPALLSKNIRYQMEPAQQEIVDVLVEEIVNRIEQHGCLDGTVVLASLNASTLANNLLVSEHYRPRILQLLTRQLRIRKGYLCSITADTKRLNYKTRVNGYPTPSLFKFVIKVFICFWILCMVAFTLACVTFGSMSSE